MHKFGSRRLMSLEPQTGDAMSLRPTSIQIQQGLTFVAIKIEPITDTIRSRRWKAFHWKLSSIVMTHDSLTSIITFIKFVAAFNYLLHHLRLRKISTWKLISQRRKIMGTHADDSRRTFTLNMMSFSALDGGKCSENVFSTRFPSQREVFAVGMMLQLSER